MAIGLIIALFFSINTCNKNRRDAQAEGNRIKAYMDTTREYKNKEGQWVAEKRVLEGSIADVKPYLTPADIADLERRFNTKLNRIQAAITFKSEGETYLQLGADPEVVYMPHEGNPYDECPPQIRYIKGVFGNRYDSSGLSFDSAWVRLGDSSSLRLKSYTTSSLILKRDYTRKFLSKNWFTTVDILNTNPNVHNTITNAFNIKDTYRKNYFELLARGGYRYFNKDNLLSSGYAGIGGEYHFKVGSISGSYNKLLGGNNFYFIEVGGKLTLIRL